MIRLETSASGIQLMRMERMEKKNALTGAMYDALADGLQAGDASQAVKVHLIAGGEGVFTAGNDIADFLEFANGGEMTDAPVCRFLRTLARAEKPIIVMVDGLAIGVGATMLLHCDMVVASARSMFKAPFLDLGLTPEAGSSFLAPKLMGHVRAFEFLCLGKSFDAAKALNCGLVNEVVDDDALESRGWEMAEGIATKPVEAMLISRQLLRGDRTELYARMEHEIEVFSERLRSEEAKNAFSSFLAR